VTVIFDQDAVEAKRFGAATSGQVMLYTASGDLAFRGGITGLRGHPGDNVGRQRLWAALEGRPPDRCDSLVFGCALCATERSAAR
jgi:hypothetical protein